MRGLVLLLFATAAIIADSHSAPAKQELAEIEELLAAAKTRDKETDVSQEESLNWLPDYSRMSEAQRYLLRGMVPLRRGEAETERQWGGFGLPRASDFPQTKTMLANSNREQIADEEGWHWTFDHPLKSHSGQEKQTAKVEAREPYPRYQQTSPSKRNETPAEYLSRQGDRMHKFLQEQEKRMLDYLDRQRNKTLAYVRYERNRTIEYMREERNNTMALLSRMQPKREASKAEKQDDQRAKEEGWGDTSYSQQDVPALPPPKTYLREATSIRIPTSWSRQEKEDMEIARMQGFLRKIAPYILKKISG